MATSNDVMKGYLVIKQPAVQNKEMSLLVIRRSRTHRREEARRLPYRAPPLLPTWNSTFVQPNKI